MIKRIEVPSNTPICEGCIYSSGDLNLSTWCKAPAGTPQCVEHDTDERLIDYIFVEDEDAQTCENR